MAFARLVGAVLLVTMSTPGAGRTPDASAAAPAPTVTGPDGWVIYGTPPTLRRDTAVPGAGSIVAPPLAAPRDPWTSGAVLPLPQGLAAGQRVTVAFWAKAATPQTVRLTFQSREAPYTAFLEDQVALTPRWRRYVRTATAPAPLAAGTQTVTLQLGQVRSAVILGPVAVLDGLAAPARVDAAFTSFHPDRVAEGVSIPSDPGVILAGTLRTPVGHGPGPFPLVIVIQGHGPNGRGGFDVLMNRLLEDGIATLEYDKRGIGSSTGAYEENAEKLTHDAQAAVAAMRRKPEIDGARIAVVGHSQGGAIAPAVAAADPRIAAIVMFAGPVGDGFDLFRRSMHDQLVRAGRPEAVVTPLVEAAIAFLQARAARADEARIAPLRTAVLDDFVNAGFPRTDAPAALATIDREEIYDNVAWTHIASDLRALRIPVLTLFGSLDPLVTAPDNAIAARAALAQNPRGKVVVFDGLSHWFKEGAKTGSEEENGTLGANIGSPRVVALVGDWLRDVLRPAPMSRSVSR